MTDKVCELINKHINKLEEEIKNLVYHGKIDNKYLAVPIGKQNLLKELKKELCK